jgi:endonuclease/exonuclease/phosphatase (EEP) superfamily protein YafD
LHRFEGPRRARALARAWVPRLLVVPWAAWAVVRAFGLEGGREPLIKAMTLTPYAAVTSLLPLVLALLLRRWRVAAVAGVVVAVFALALAGRALPGPQPAVDGVRIDVVALNVYTGLGDARAIVALVRAQRADVLTLEELPPEEVARLDAAGLRRLLPYRDVDARPGANGSGLFSRFPLEPRKPYNSINQNGEPRALVKVPGAQPIDLQVVHPPPPIHGWAPIWRHMLGELPRPRRDGDQLRMLMGDFNATLDHHQLRALLGGDHGYVDAADATGKGLVPTWPELHHLPPYITIDHVLADPRMRADDVSIHTVPGTDHRAVAATLTVPRALR